MVSFLQQQSICFSIYHKLIRLKSMFVCGLIEKGFWMFWVGRLAKIRFIRDTKWINIPHMLKNFPAFKFRIARISSTRLIDANSHATLAFSLLVSVSAYNYMILTVGLTSLSSRAWYLHYTSTCLNGLLQNILFGLHYDGTTHIYLFCNTYFFSVLNIISYKILLSFFWVFYVTFIWCFFLNFSGSLAY